MSDVHCCSPFIFLPWVGPPLKGPGHGVRVCAGGGDVVMMMMMRRRMEGDGGVGGVPGCCAGEGFQS